MTLELVAILVGLVALVAAGAALGWLASLRFARPPQPPAPISLSHADVRALRHAIEPELEGLKRALRELFDAFENNTTRVVLGLQEGNHSLKDEVRDEVARLTQQLERISAWAPGQEPESPAALARWMGESSDDRKAIHRRLDLQAKLIIGLYSLAPLIVVIFLRIVYVIIWGAS
jgi:hypothetical protein